MEKNLQNKSEINTSTNDGNTTFGNRQPGQQLPTKDEAAVRTNSNDVQGKERHSESSKPDTQNETLGTP